MKKNDEADFLKLARERFSDAESAESSNRTLSLRDQKFENGEQWTDQEKEERKGRPCMVDNRIAGAVKQITGDARMNRPRIKVRPVDSSADPFIAEIYTGLIRNIENISDAESAYDTGHASGIYRHRFPGGQEVRRGIGYWRVITEYSDDDAVDEQDILIERIPNSQSVYFDQSGIKCTYEDAGHCFIADAMRKDKYLEKWPKAQVVDWDDEGQGESMAGWFATETVRVAEYWYKEPYVKHLFKLTDGTVIEIKNPKIETVEGEGSQPIQMVKDGDGSQMQFLKHREVKSHKVYQAIISGAEILSGPNEWPGKYIPVIPCLGEEIWIEGERILRSAIRHAIDPQRVHNWNVSNDIETKALGPKQPWLLTPEQLGENKELWDKAHITPMPYLTWTFVPGQPTPQRLFGSVSDSGAIQGIAMSIDAIKAATGIFDASLGNRGNETSGVAIERRQRQGSLATYVFTDNQTRAVKHTGKILVDLIPKIYDSDRVIRLLGDDLRKAFAKYMPGPNGEPPQRPGPDGRPLVNVDPKGFEASVRINFKDPISGAKYNDLSVGKYDITVDAGPGYMTRRQEAADGMMQLTQANPVVMPVTVPRIARNLDWPDAEDIGDELKAILQPQQQGPDPKDQIALAKGKQDLQKGQIEIEGKKLDLAGKAQEIRAERMDQQQMMAHIAQQVVINTLKQLGMV